MPSSSEATGMSRLKMKKFLKQQGVDAAAIDACKDKQSLEALAAKCGIKWPVPNAPPSSDPELQRWKAKDLERVQAELEKDSKRAKHPVRHKHGARTGYVTVGVPQGAAGGDAIVVCVEGERHTARIPAGLKPGDKFKFKPDKKDEECSSGGVSAALRDLDKDGDGKVTVAEFVAPQVERHRQEQQNQAKVAGAAPEAASKEVPAKLSGTVADQKKNARLMSPIPKEIPAPEGEIVDEGVHRHGWSWAEYEDGTRVQRDVDGAVHWQYVNNATHGVKQYSTLADGSLVVRFLDGCEAQREPDGSELVSWPGGRSIQTDASGLRIETDARGRKTHTADGITVQILPDSEALCFNPFNVPGMPNIVRVQNNMVTRIQHFIAADGTDIQVNPDKSMIMTLPDGTVKRMDASEAARHCTTEINGADVRQVFNKFDEDGSGCVDPMEVVHSFGELGVVIQKEQMQALFERVDSDHSGTIGIDEFNTMVRTFLHPVEFQRIMKMYGLTK